MPRCCASLAVLCLGSMEKMVARLLLRPQRHWRQRSKLVQRTRAINRRSQVDAALAPARTHNSSAHGACSIVAQARTQEALAPMAALVVGTPRAQQDQCLRVRRLALQLRKSGLLLLPWQKISKRAVLRLWRPLCDGGQGFGSKLRANVERGTLRVRWCPKLTLLPMRSSTLSLIESKQP